MAIKGGREICLDTETTGLSSDDRIIEIACVEVEDYMPTGREFHVYVNPQRKVSKEAEAVHGLSNEFLNDKPLFKDIVGDFLAFIGDQPLVIHNASFDMRMLNAEMRRLRMKELPNEYIDTVALAKKQFGNAKVNLDALCTRFGIDNSARDKHGALIDTRLLARVYLELHGGRERVLEFISKEKTPILVSNRPFREPRIIGKASSQDLESHQAFMSGFKKSLWSEIEQALQEPQVFKMNP